jgi:nitroimidazol reductase NimA-like FMN-containing flavoprotein (pyridoxamine 5'-phosphate oxidase superfamily)
MPSPRSSKPSTHTPAASRPIAQGYGFPSAAEGLLPWTWAEKRLVESHNYWFVSVRPDAAPHAMPIWGVWVEQRFYFSTGAKSRKARNLARNRKCVICTEKAHEAVIVEGTAAPIKDKKLLARIAPHYHKKYKPWKLDPKMGPIFEVRPQTTFAMYEKKFAETATKWEWS